MGDEFTVEDRLLPGEGRAVQSDDAEDAKVWYDVYTELTGFKQRLLTELHEQSHTVASEGQPEVGNDESILREEADRLLRRLDFWREEVDRRGGGTGLGRG